MLMPRSDSSKRAVEAADNVVHAYDLDMQVPQLPTPPKEHDLESLRSEVSPRIFPAPSPSVSSNKRKTRDFEDDEQQQPGRKHRQLSIWDHDRASTPRSAALRSLVYESSHITSAERSGFARSERGSSPTSPVTPGMKVTRVREVVRIVVNESLRFGGRPDSAIATATGQGETIEVRNRTASGETSTKVVDWTVEASVPDEVAIDERDFAKLISVLFLNALKFTHEGSVNLVVRLSPKMRHLMVNVVDTGPGIPAAFRPNLFKPFTQEDTSLTRHNEGLGLGLMVAKGIARRIGGDLSCVRSNTEGPLRGTEFELRIPLMPSSDSSSRHSSPSRCPTPLHLDGHQTPLYESNSLLTSPVTSQRRCTTSETTPAGEQPISSVPANLFTSPNKQRDRAACHSRDGSTSKPPPAPPLRPALPPTSVTTASESVTKTATTTSTPRTPTFDRKLGSKYPLNVLIAEDNRINRKLLLNMLKKLGYGRVQEAFDGAEAVRLMEADAAKGEGSGDKIDVILMDLWMPNMDGYEAARRILRMKNAKSPRILAVSADITDEALERAKQVGMHGFMTKPYRMLDLERLLIQYCSP
jgi:CheY-like chemotaxis protein